MQRRQAGQHAVLRRERDALGVHALLQHGHERVEVALAEVTLCVKLEAARLLQELDEGVEVAAIRRPGVGDLWEGEELVRDALPADAVLEADLRVVGGEELLGVGAEGVPGGIAEDDVEAAVGEDLGECEVPVEEGVARGEVVDGVAGTGGERRGGFEDLQPESLGGGVELARGDLGPDERRAPDVAVEALGLVGRGGREGRVGILLGAEVVAGRFGSLLERRSGGAEGGVEGCACEEIEGSIMRLDTSGSAAPEVEAWLAAFCNLGCEAPGRNGVAKLPTAA